MHNTYLWFKLKQSGTGNLTFYPDIVLSGAGIT